MVAVRCTFIYICIWTTYKVSDLSKSLFNSYTCIFAYIINCYKIVLRVFYNMYTLILYTMKINA